MATPEVQAFLDATLAAQLHAERALHNGDVVPRLSTWSHGDRITLFGAGVPWRTGWGEVRPVFEWLASTFAACDEYSFELLAAGASGDLAYTVGIERYGALLSTGATVHNALRATHIYQRDTDGWRIVHRHGDHVPDDVSTTRVTARPTGEGSSG
jgi:ketosteroid isomerase-like protein